MKKSFLLFFVLLGIESMLPAGLMSSKKHQPLASLLKAKRMVSDSPLAHGVTLVKVFDRNVLVKDLHERNTVGERVSDPTHIRKVGWQLIQSGDLMTEHVGSETLTSSVP